MRATESGGGTHRPENAVRVFDEAPQPTRRLGEKDMGRIADLCGQIAAEAEEGPDGPVISPDVREQLRAEWDEGDIDDALSLVRDSLLQSDLVDAADSLSARLVEVLGAFGTRSAFVKAEAGEARISLEIIEQLTRRVARLEEALEAFREGAPPDRKGFDALRRRLMDQGIETEMWGPQEEEDEGRRDPEDE